MRLYRGKVLIADRLKLIETKRASFCTLTSYYSCQMQLFVPVEACISIVDHFVCFQGECDPEIIASKLDLYSSSCPHVTQIANYWLCRARIAQQEKDFDRVVCLLEQAFVFKAQVIQLFGHPIYVYELSQTCHVIK